METRIKEAHMKYSKMMMMWHSGMVMLPLLFNKDAVPRESVCIISLLHHALAILSKLDFNEAPSFAKLFVQ